MLPSTCETLGLFSNTAHAPTHTCAVVFTTFPFTSHLSSSLVTSSSLTVFPRDFLKEVEQDLVESFPLGVSPLLRCAG